MVRDIDYGPCEVVARGRLRVDVRVAAGIPAATFFTSDPRRNHKGVSTSSL